MKPVDFPQSNRKMVAPRGQEDNVYSMYADINPNGHVYACWQMSDEELEILSKNKKIWLNFAGGLPPHHVSVESPYQDSALDLNGRRQTAITHIMDHLAKNESAIMLGVNTEVVTLTPDEFEYIVGALPYMKGQSNAAIKEVAKNVDTLSIGVAGGGMIIVRR